MIVQTSSPTNGKSSCTHKAISNASRNSGRTTLTIVPTLVLGLVVSVMNPPFRISPTRLRRPVTHSPDRDSCRANLGRPYRPTGDLSITLDDAKRLRIRNMQYDQSDWGGFKSGQTLRISGVEILFVIAGILVLGINPIEQRSAKQRAALGSCFCLVDMRSGFVV